MEPDCTECCGSPGSIAGGFFLFLVLGFVAGVLLCLTFFKFVQWMGGRSLVFVPWPKILEQQTVAEDPNMNNPTYELDYGAELSIGNSISNLKFTNTKGTRSVPLAARGGVAGEVCADIYEPIKEKELDLEFRPSQDMGRVLNSHLNRKDRVSGEAALSKNASELCRKPSLAACMSVGGAVKLKPVVSVKPATGRRSPVHSSGGGGADHAQGPACSGGGASGPAGNHVLRGVPVLLNH